MSRFFSVKFALSTRRTAYTVISVMMSAVAVLRAASSPASAEPSQAVRRERDMRPDRQQGLLLRSQREARRSVSPSWWLSTGTATGTRWSGAWLWTTTSGGIVVSCRLDHFIRLRKSRESVRPGLQRPDEVAWLPLSACGQDGQQGPLFDPDRRRGNQSCARCSPARERRLAYNGAEQVCGQQLLVE